MLYYQYKYPHMEYMKKMMRKKINFWVAVLIILIVTVSGAVAVTVQAIGYYFGGMITYVGFCEPGSTLG